MKKLLVVMLCALTVMSAFTSCKNYDNEDLGAVIPVYIADEIANFDPAYANLDDSAIKILGLLYEGLYRINEDGKVVKAQAKSLKVLDDPEEDYYAIEIKLNDTKWSDGVQVLAQDYIDAWTRILDSDFRGEAANMLYDIKNARAIVAGDVSIDDIGLSDVTKDTIRIEFEQQIDYDKFCEYLASPLLAPIRRTAIDKVEKDWSSNTSILVSNGPFFVRTYTAGEKLIIERNKYYYRDIEKDSIKESVTPYRLAIYFGKNAATTSFEEFEKGNLVYTSYIPLEKREEYKDKAEVVDTMSILSYVFNTNVAPFDNADVRKALSMAIDRNEIVKMLVFAEPAEGLIADGVFNTEYSKKAESFREAGEALISASADLAAAKELIKNANVTDKDITLTVRNNEVDLAVANYVKEVWKSLGFNVTVDALKYRKYKDEMEYDLVSDPYLDAYDSGNFEVICIDYTMLTTDAFPNLAHFARAFASGVINYEGGLDGATEVELTPHISGYYNAEYDAKIEAAFAEKLDLAKRAQLLHEAEKILIGDMPIMPLVELKHAYVTSKDISKLDDAYYGYQLFTDAVLKNISKYPDNVGYETTAE